MDLKHEFLEGRELVLLTYYGPLRTNAVQRSGGLEIVLTCATWPGRWENHGQDKAVGCRCLEVFAKEAVIMVIWSEPLPLPPRILRVYNWRVLQGPGALPIPQLALQPQEGGICSPGGHRWEAVRLSRLWSTHCSIWLERKWEGVKLLWVERHPEGLCSPFPPHTRQAATRMPWEERGGWAHTSAVPRACL